jgi:hypothetical protein
MLGNCNRRPLVVVVGLSIAAIGAARDVHACSTVLTPPELWGFPSDGSVDIPTDVTPTYALIYAWIDEAQLPAAHFHLTDRRRRASIRSVAASGRSSTECPSSVTVPAVGVSGVSRMRIVVVCPRRWDRRTP